MPVIIGHPLRFAAVEGATPCNGCHPQAERNEVQRSLRVKVPTNVNAQDRCRVDTSENQEIVARASQDQQEQAPQV